MDRSAPRTAARLGTTHWSLVLAAAHQNEALGGLALENLCRAYWAPLYAFARHSGLAPEVAQDVTQETFARLLNGDGLLRADPVQGRFRSYLLGCLKNVMAMDWRKSQTQMRGGGLRPVALEDLAAEEAALSELTDTESPDRLYERAWARALLEQVISRLREEMDAAGTGNRFEVLKTYIADVKGALSMTEAMAQLGLSLPAVKGAIHRLRQRYVALVREEVAATVSTPEEVADEVHALFAALGR